MSPFLKPRRLSAVATRRTASTNCRYVSVRPVGPSMIAGLSASRVACRRTKSWIVEFGISIEGLGLLTIMRSLRADAEREEHVAGRTKAEIGVSRIHEQHATRDNRPGAVERAALRRDAVHGCVWLGGIVFPDHAAVAGRVGAHDAVGRSGEHDARNDGDRSGLRLRTSGAGAVSRRRRRFPYLLAGRKVERRESAGLRPQLLIGGCEVAVLIVRGRTPLDAAERAARAHFVFPHQRALFVRINAPRSAGLLADHDHRLAVRQVTQNRRVAEVEIRAHDVWTVVLSGPAPDQKRVVRRELV